jgi:hypothetical protein
MKSESLLKKFFLLTFSTIFALQLQLANAQEDAGNLKSGEDGAECVIKEDE